MSNIILITKDALCKDYLPTYGNRYWKGKTPNIDELASKGTVFHHCYTAAPSTVMSFRSMMTGVFPYEQPYEDYSPKEIPESETDFFSVARRMGYSCHILWDTTWVNMVLKYGNCFGQKTVIHNLDDIKQGVGCHYNRQKPLVNDSSLTEATIRRIVEELKNITATNEKVFVWVHLPHVINGRTAYGGDIDVFDDFIGKCRTIFDDDHIYISADHGNMNAFKGKYCYGFDVYTPAIEIPLITPRICNRETVDDFISNVDFKELILNGKITKRDFIYSDTAYYCQPHRKLAIIHDGFSYIYNKEGSSEELYDIINDPSENCNLLLPNYKDPDRHLSSPVREYYYSPHWDNIASILSAFRNEKKRIWRHGPWATEFYQKNLRKAKFMAVGIMKKFKHN